MTPARVDPALVSRFPALAKVADDLDVISARFAAVRIEPVLKGSQDARGISWRCKSIANASLLRGEELLRFAIGAINEGAIVTAFILTRALDETLAAVITAIRKIGSAVDSNDEKRLTETLK